MFNAKGKLSNQWNYDLNFLSSRTKADFTYLNDISKSRALNALNVTGTALNPSCVSGNDCSPWNIFTISNGELQSSASLGVTKDALDLSLIHI